MCKCCLPTDKAISSCISLFSLALPVVCHRKQHSQHSMSSDWWMCAAPMEMASVHWQCLPNLQCVHCTGRSLFLLWHMLTILPYGPQGHFHLNKMVAAILRSHNWLCLAIWVNTDKTTDEFTSNSHISQTISACYVVHCSTCNTITLMVKVLQSWWGQQRVLFCWIACLEKMKKKQKQWITWACLND